MTDEIEVCGLRASFARADVLGLSVASQPVMVFALFASLGASSVDSEKLLRSTYELTIDRHISELMPLFLSESLSHEWNPRLKSATFHDTKELGRLVHQEYSMPWPLATRDMLMRCSTSISQRETRVKMSCGSVQHAVAPVRSGTVRMELSETAWDIVSMPGDRTRIWLSIAVPQAMAVGVPKFVVNYCQRSMLRDSVSNLLGAVDRLQLPHHASFIAWRRTRAEASRAQTVAAVEEWHTRGPSARYLLLYCSARSLLLVWAAVVALVLFYSASRTALHATCGRSRSRASRRNSEPSAFPSFLGSQHAARA